MEKTARREQNIHRKILIVDDEAVNRKLLGLIVSQGYEAIYAENGAQALQLIQENQKLISLVLLDLLMPEMNGYELLEIMRADPALKRIPVIVLTSEKTAEVRSLQMGAADFIPKPYDLPEVVLARIHHSIQLAEDNIIIHETETDELTGLYTKGFFYQYARQFDRYCSDKDMDALVLNINRFHLINELNGREYGNYVLCTIADTIREILNQTNGLACRCEADNFFIYIPHQAEYQSIFEKIESKFSEMLKEAPISIRIGIYENVDKMLDIEQRFDRANLACTKPKHSYSNAYSYYDTQMHEREIFSERLISEMDSALREKQFCVVYQPKYEIKGEKPTLKSAEALVRWFHPELGMVSPGKFIPLFEENGLVQKLDRYVWREAAEQVRKWKEQYGISIPVSVNVSRIDIYDPELENELLDIVHSNHLETSELLLEITESAYTDNSEQIVQKVEQLRADGFRIEMDDFGSGYSSLNMLTALPIDALKLDMRFIRNICTSEKALKMVELMIEIAEFLNVPVISEGVETKEQYQLLKEIGCDIIQGYYFSKPVKPEEFCLLIEKEIAQREEQEYAYN